MNDTMNITLEIKAVSGREFEGHGSVFNNVDLGGDIVMPGAFAKSLADHESAGSLPQMFWMHRADQVPGVWTAMKEDSKGLYVKGELVKTPLGDEMHTLLNRKAVRGLSIGYQVKDAEYDKQTGAYRLKEIDLWEVSLVSLAMNPLAQVEAMKSRLSGDGEYVPTEREFERLLREAGCSRKVAATLVAKLYDTPSRGILDDDVDPEAAEVLKSLQALTESTWTEVFRA
jgi:HK97 family phage prohead protease